QQAGEHLPGDAGYGGLSAVSAQLSRRGFIYSLFQPARGARAAYRLLVVLTGNARLPHKLLCLAVAVFEIAPLEVLVSLALLLGLGWWGG
ncbi:RpoH suppressor, partial [Stenotrophomonas geniculata]